MMSAFTENISKRWFVAYKNSAIITFCIFFCIFYSVCNGQTTIVAIRTIDGVFIGADNKTLLGDSSYITCKIRIVNNVVIAISGNFSMVGKWQYDAYELAKERFSANKSIIENINSYKVFLKDTIEKSLKCYNIDSLYEITRDTVNGFMNIIFAGINNEIPVMYILKYFGMINNNKDIVISYKIKDCTTILKDGECNWYITGEVDAIMSFIKNKPMWYKNMYEDNIIRRWIIMEHFAVPDIVGLPMDIIKITKDTIEWIENPNCK